MKAYEFFRDFWKFIFSKIVSDDPKFGEIDDQLKAKGR